MPGGGFPLEPLLAEIRAMGHKVPQPPSAEASRMAAMRDLWTGAGLASVETREIAVERTYRDFNEFWTSSMASPSVTAALAAMSSADVEQLKAARARQAADGYGRAHNLWRARQCRQRPRAVLGFGMAPAPRSR